VWAHAQKWCITAEPHCTACAPHRQVQRAIFHEISQAPRSADYNGCASPELCGLCFLRHTTIDAHRVDIACRTSVLQHSVDLLCQFTGRSNAQAPRRLAGRTAASPLFSDMDNSRYAKGKCFACTPTEMHVSHAMPRHASAPHQLQLCRSFDRR
jgi:hypothetical protein